MRPGRNRVAIITHGFWQRRLGGDPAVIGRVLTLDGVPVEIVGVLPATFRLPQLPQLSVPNRVDNPFELFRPLAWSEACAPVVGRVRQRGDRSPARRRLRSGHRGGAHGDHEGGVRAGVDSPLCGREAADGGRDRRGAAAAVAGARRRRRGAAHRLRERRRLDGRTLERPTARARDSHRHRRRTGAPGTAGGR